MRTRRLLVTTLAPVLLIAACATGTTPGAGGTGGAGETTGAGSTSPGGVVSSPGAGDPGTPSPGEGSGSAGTAPAPEVSADLTVSLDETGTGTYVTWTLTCDPAGGDHPDPAAACAALVAAGGADAFAPIPRDQMCTEIYGGDQVARVVGTVGRGTGGATFARTNGCEIARWDPLAPLLGSTGGVQR